MKIRILPSASNDLVDGFNFYEKQSNSLGDYFLDTLFADIDSLIIYHSIHSVYFDNYYRLLSKRFPFAVYYKIKKDIIEVSAVLDCRGDPISAKNKLN